VRRSVNVTLGVKTRVEELKKHMKFKTESEVLAYLCCLYDDMYSKITLDQDHRVKEMANTLNA